MRSLQARAEHVSFDSARRGGRREEGEEADARARGRVPRRWPVPSIAAVRPLGSSSRSMRRVRRRTPAVVPRRPGRRRRVPPGAVARLCLSLLLMGRERPAVPPRARARAGPRTVALSAGAGRRRGSRAVIDGEGRARGRDVARAVVGCARACGGVDVAVAGGGGGGGGGCRGRGRVACARGEGRGCTTTTEAPSSAAAAGGEGRWWCCCGRVGAPG